MSERRIAIAGLHSEQSTFSLRTVDESFYAITRGEEMLPQYNFRARLGDIVDGVTWLPAVRAMGAASGPLLPESFDAILAETRTALETGLPYDGVYLEMHGAANVLGRQHAEETYVAMVREVVGPDAVISLSMDTHGNFSEELMRLVDLAACHRHAPHIDNLDTRDRAVRNLLETLERGTRPYKAWVRVPVLLPGERTSTVVEPGATVFARQLPLIEQHGVLDAALWVGFAWADEDRNAAAVLVTSWERESAVACARALAEAYWDAREEFVIVVDHSGDWDAALDFVVSGAKRPVFVSDSGDNVRAGASGDVTVALHATVGSPALQAAGVRSLFAGLVDADAFAAAQAAGIGGVIERSIGACLDFRYAPAVPGRWTVEGFIEGQYGEGTAGVLVRDGLVSVVIQRTAAPFIAPGDPSSPALRWEGCIHLDTSGYDMVVVKNGYQFPSQLAAAGSSFMAITPGGTDLDMSRLRFQNVWRPVFPLDAEFAADLEPILVEGAAR
ncbi:M81 family metallopeptidase [Microbacterium sp. ET2]|uniref:M81 family metallopeptidase n=1 Tax=Microbacterium albipurpureum TaxID=3050384 RepID=UPI00259CB39E|nr:M81 family metallopeptidase [Microbacterium sp. ET2 (Ac-2212)]WJL96755.1 M81 family metallopeptidase [Microbacterium sp. ET2 (Ac-2212)]